MIFVSQYPQVMLTKKNESLEDKQALIFRMYDKKGSCQCFQIPQSQIADSETRIEVLSLTALCLE